MRSSNRPNPGNMRARTAACLAAGSYVLRQDDRRCRVMPRQSAPWLDQCRHMAHALRGPVLAALLIVSFGIPARAQTEQFWPEVSTFVKLNDQMRFYFLATTVKETRESTEGEFGPNFDFYIKPLRKKNRALGMFRLDESKNRLCHGEGRLSLHPSIHGRRSRLSIAACWRQRLAILCRVECSSRTGTAWICALLEENTPGVTATG